MNLIQRVKSILLEPKLAWAQIEVESTSTAKLYTDYLMILAVIPAVAGFIGMSIIGYGGMGLSFRVPFFAGLMNMVVSYVLSLVAIFVMSLIVDALAPTFKGQKNSLSALKLMVYASTAALVGGIFNLIPALGIIGLLAALYSVYLIYLGLPVLMKCPQDKAVAYTAVTVLCGILLGVVIGALASLTLPSRGIGNLGSLGGMPGASADKQVTVSVPGADIKIDTARLEAMAKKMEQAGKQMESAQQSGDSAAAGKAMGDIIGAMSGAGATLPIPSDQLKARLPEAVGDLKRESIESQSSQAMGMGGSSAKASYAQGQRRVDLSITDLGGFAGVAAMAGWANVTADRETAEKVEKTYKQGQRTIKEEAWKDGSRGELTVLLANGVVVEANGHQVDLPTVRSIVDSLGLDLLEAIKRPAKS
ncbi:MAG: Yip1 family protein [Ideonella sp.]